MAVVKTLKACLLSHIPAALRNRRTGERQPEHL